MGTIQLLLVWGGVLQTWQDRHLVDVGGTAPVIHHQMSPSVVENFRVNLRYRKKSEFDKENPHSS